MRFIQWTFWIAISFAYICCETLSLPVDANSDSIQYSGDTKTIKTAIRVKRDPKGQYRGQSQSQYLNFGNSEHEGKAEAEATEQGSRAFVTGTHGMGQAQSQYSGGDCSGCTGCICDGYEPPEPLKGITDSYGSLLRPEILDKNLYSSGKSGIIHPEQDITSIRQPGYIQAPSTERIGNVHPEQQQPNTSDINTRSPDHLADPSYKQWDYKQSPSVDYSKQKQQGQIQNAAYPVTTNHPAVYEPGYLGVSAQRQLGYKPSSRTSQPDVAHSQQIQPQTHTNTVASGYLGGPAYGQTGHTQSHGMVQPGVAHLEQTQPGAQGPNIATSNYFGQRGHSQSHGMTQPRLVNLQYAQPGFQGAGTQQRGYPGSPAYAQPGYKPLSGTIQPGVAHSQQIQPQTHTNTVASDYLGGPAYGQTGHTQSHGMVQPGVAHLEQTQPGAEGPNTATSDYFGDLAYGQRGHTQSHGMTQPGLVNLQYAQPSFQGSDTAVSSRGPVMSHIQSPGMAQQVFQGLDTQEREYSGNPAYAQLGNKLSPGTIQPGRVGYPQQIQPDFQDSHTQRRGYHDNLAYEQPGGTFQSVPLHLQTQTGLQSPATQVAGYSGGQIYEQRGYREPSGTQPVAPGSEAISSTNITNSQSPCQGAKDKIVTIVGRDKECGSLTILVGTDGPRQTVISDNQLLKDSTQVQSGKSPQQLVHAPAGGLTLLVGTDGPIQTVYKATPETISDQTRSSAVSSSPDYTFATGLKQSHMRPNQIYPLYQGTGFTTSPNMISLQNKILTGPTKTDKIVPMTLDRTKSDEVYSSPYGSTRFSGAESSYQSTDFQFVGTGTAGSKTDVADSGKYFLQKSAREAPTGTEGLKFGFAGQGTIWPETTYYAPSHIGTADSRYSAVYPNNRLNGTRAYSILPTLTKTTSIYPERAVVQPEAGSQTDVGYLKPNQGTSIMHRPAGETPGHIRTDSFSPDVEITADTEHITSTKTSSGSSNFKPTSGYTSGLTGQIESFPHHLTTPGFVPITQDARTGTTQVFAPVPTHIQPGSARYHAPGIGKENLLHSPSATTITDDVSVQPRLTPGGVYDFSGGTYPVVRKYPAQYEIGSVPSGLTSGAHIPGFAVDERQSSPPSGFPPNVGTLHDMYSTPHGSSGSVGCNGKCLSNNSGVTGVSTGHLRGETVGLDKNIIGGQLASSLADDSFSQAESSVKDGHAKASAQGKKAGGTAQTQVSGTYTGNGSFSANAMTSDSDRSANAQISGSSEGALSQAQGSGGVGKSQSQVQVDSKTGGTTAQSQSGGHAHQSQSEVQANEKGGLADAQSSGPGQTSSQAQIGFKPQGNEVENNNPVFNGGGEASAQSSSHSGQSQSQIHGKFKYGISYHGAAQAAAGTKEQVASYREQNKVLFQTISQFGNSQNAVTEKVDALYGPGSSVPYSENSYTETDLRLRTGSNNEVLNKENDKMDEDIDYEEEDEIEYDEDEAEIDYSQIPVKISPKTVKVDYGDKHHNELKTSFSSVNETKASDIDKNSPTQKQQTSTSEDSAENKFSLVQKQNGQTIRFSPKPTTERVPDGFRGTINLEKKYHTRYLPSRHLEGQNALDKETAKQPDSYVTVTKSVTGSLDNSKNPPTEKQNFSSTYYTKSSTCGYFTFSCSIVYGTNGRSKICRPKKPTNGKC